MWKLVGGDQTMGDVPKKTRFSGTGQVPMIAWQGVILMNVEIDNGKKN